MPLDRKPHQPIRRPLLFLLLATLLAQLTVPAPAQSASGFQIQQVRELEPEYNRPYTRYILLSGTNRLGFVPPEQWRLTGDTEKRRVTLTEANMRASITLTVLAPESIPDITPKAGQEPNIKPGSLPQAPSLDQWRALVMATFPGAKIEKEWESIANGARATTFELAQVTDGVRQNVRAAFIYRNGAAYQMILSTGANFADYIGPFMGMLGSFEF